MERVTIAIRRVAGNDDIPLPRYMTGHSAGMDIYAAVRHEEVIPPGKWKLIPTGIEIALPEGFEAQIRPRSGLALRNGVTLLNTPGTIDSDYRGELGIIMINFSDEPFVTRRGDRIAQMVVHRVCRAAWEECDVLEATTRGDGGFGHTGQ
jgi:dUTP pyrophosphatase